MAAQALALFCGQTPATLTRAQKLGKPLAVCVKRGVVPTCIEPFVGFSLFGCFPKRRFFFNPSFPWAIDLDPFPLKDRQLMFVKGVVGQSRRRNRRLLLW